MKRSIPLILIAAFFLFAACAPDATEEPAYVETPKDSPTQTLTPLEVSIPVLPSATRAIETAPAPPIDFESSLLIVEWSKLPELMPAITSCNVLSGSYTLPVLYFGVNLNNANGTPVRSDIPIVGVLTNSRGDVLYNADGTYQVLFTGQLFAQPEGVTGAYTHTSQIQGLTVYGDYTFYQLRALNPDGTIDGLVGGETCTITVKVAQPTQKPKGNNNDGGGGGTAA